MTSTYKPQPGTTAYRILAWLEADDKMAETTAILRVTGCGREVER